jgi:hypothetical protein
MTTPEGTPARRRQPTFIFRGFRSFLDKSQPDVTGLPS